MSQILTSVNARGLILLLLLGNDVSFNPGPLMLSVLNARSVRNKGLLLGDIVTSYDLDFLCLTETHAHLSDTFSFSPDFIFLQRSHSSDNGNDVDFYLRFSYRLHKRASPFHRSFEDMVASLGFTAAH